MWRLKSKERNQEQHILVIDDYFIKLSLTVKQVLQRNLVKSENCPATVKGAKTRKSSEQ